MWDPRQPTERFAPPIVLRFGGGLELSEGGEPMSLQASPGAAWAPCCVESMTRLRFSSGPWWDWQALLRLVCLAGEVQGSVCPASAGGGREEA